ncbi:MAG: type IX secretion system sortase PorU [Edaphocola sp.]
MKQFFIVVAWLCASLVTAAQEPVVSVVPVAAIDHHKVDANGYYVERIVLPTAAAPQVRITNVQTDTLPALPSGIKPVGTFDADVHWGIERKQPVAYIHVPIFRQQNGLTEKMTAFQLEITTYIDPAAHTPKTAGKPTTVSNSVLASGTWYKIAVPSRGIYKIDYSFLQDLGLNPGAINPANIRLYGNGGTVIPEEADSMQADDLIENAIYVSSSGSTFGSGDYVLFYANGPTRWDKDSANGRFTHVSNYYEDQSYYFLNFDLGAGKRIATEQATGTAAMTVSTYNDYALIDKDTYNIGGQGKVWWGNRMNSINSSSWTQNISVDLGQIADTVHFETYIGSVNESSSSIAVKLNSTVLQTSYFTLSAGSDYAIKPATIVADLLPGSASFNINYQYTPGGTGAGYVDYLEFNYKRPLTLSGQVTFRNWATAALASGQNAAYVIQGSSPTVWDVTDPLTPVALTGTAGSGSYTVVRPGNSLREFAAFDGTQFLTPTKIGQVANQDLHGLSQVDLLVISPAQFISTANEIADYHRQEDGISVAVAVIDEIYNEFSSGSRDIAGIRNFIKMFYDRATDESDMIKNVLFVGAASYDYKDRLSNNTNYVPTFQTYESVYYNGAYSSDDFFAMLDQGDNVNNSSSLVDIGTGRIPVIDTAEANIALNKIKTYNSAAAYGAWRNVVAFVADDHDGAEENSSMNHLDDCETINSFFYSSDDVFNVNKIYADAYTQQSTPGGGRYPAVNTAIDNQMYNGCLLMSYSGHGGPTRWAHEGILTADDYGNWTNGTKLPVMVTATCDFGRFDDPGERSAGVKIALSKNGGAIAMVTTTQLVYQSQNTAIASFYVKRQFTKTNGAYPTLGQALAAAKNAYASGGTNNHKYVVLGDPALYLAIPNNQVATQKLAMLQDGIATETDTVKALGVYELTGVVTDANGATLTTFNGTVDVTIYDKMKSVQTVNTESGVTPSFKVQNNIVAQVQGTVANGVFTVTFIAPKDINYDYGYGKISYYAYSDSDDAAGYDTTITIGDYNRDAAEDNEGPAVKPYIDDNKFRDGGVTGPSPLLYVELYDDNGINVSGNSLGHDLVAILDEDLQNPYVMNSYYQTAQNDYRNGTVSFPFYDLAEGKHTLRVKAWDVYNNSGEGVVNFEVRKKESGVIGSLYCYPNPVTNGTRFVFQHNQENEEMDVNIEVYTATGVIVKNIQQSLTTTGNRTEIYWDGKGNNGVPLVKGVYFYRLTLKTTNGVAATAHQKLVMLQ